MSSTESKEDETAKLKEQVEALEADNDRLSDEVSFLENDVAELYERISEIASLEPHEMVYLDTLLKSARESTTMPWHWTAIDKLVDALDKMSVDS